MYRRILAAVNEHLNSEVAARYALHLARVCAAEFYLCFVADKNTPPAVFDHAQAAMKRLFIEAEKTEIKAESITRTGQAVEEIGAIVRNERIDIVFAATRREDVERRFYAGTVARSLSLKHHTVIQPSKTIQFPLQIP